MAQRILTCFLFHLLTFLTIKLQPAAASGDIFQFIRGPVPDVFTVGQHYPSRNETEECRPIRIRIERDTTQFRNNLVVNTNPGIDFANSDARRMTSRLQTRLNRLANRYYEEYGLRLTVLRAWVEYRPGEDGLDDSFSLHYEGRTVSIQVRAEHFSSLLQLGVEVGFDWVFYAAQDYVRMSVIPDVCDANLDLVFMLDQSGSVGDFNHGVALKFLEDVVSFYSIAPNSTQVGLITYSTSARVEFGLNEHTDITSLQRAISNVEYRGGWTTTALALLLALNVLNPSRQYGTRPLTAGVPRIAVLITDGRSNIYSIRNIAPALRLSGVQVYTVGIGNIYLDELLFIASDPDVDHVFLLNSFNEAPNFVDFLSLTACDTPAIVTPGDNTITEVEEDAFRFFQSECPAFSMTIMIEQIDLVGTCSLYASTIIQNPGPLSPHGVISNEDHSRRKRSIQLHLTNQNRFVYWSVKGVDPQNRFSVIIWDMIFPEDTFTVTVPERVSGHTVFSLNDALRMTNVTFTYTIQSGNDAGLFDIDQGGNIVTAAPLDANAQFSLMIVAQNANFSCHRGRVNIEITVSSDRIEFPPLQNVSILENTTQGANVTQVNIMGSDNTVEYSIISGNIDNVFTIDGETGTITLSRPIDFESISSYILTVQAVQTSTGSVASAMQTVSILDVNESPFFITPCAIANNCTFSVNEQSAPNTEIATIVAGDPDIPTSVNGQLIFSINGDVPFEIVQTDQTAVIRTAINLPDDVFTFVFELVVSDVEFSIATPFTVDIIDINNNAPEFVNPPVLSKVVETTGIGITVAQFVAMDADQGVNGEIIFSISSDGPLPFSIDPINGTLFVSNLLDFENTSLYTLTVTASNPDGLQNTSVQTSILIIDANDNPPSFSQEVYIASIDEHSVGGTAILTLMASDADSGSNGEINFSITSGNIENVFTLTTFSPDIALISVAIGADINREEIPSYTLTVTAIDQGTPQMSDTAQVLITITDINDNPPNFLPEIFNLQLREDLVPITDIITVFVFDLDEPLTPNTEVDFSITNGNIGNVFFLNKTDDNTAILQLVGELSFEMQPSYTLTLTATDRGTNPGPQSSNATVYIAVENVLTSPPVIVTGNLTINVSDSTDVGTALAVINATDADGDQIRFMINSVEGEGNGGNGAMDIFSIDAEGVVRLAQRLDSAISTRFEIEIQVTDGILTTTTILVVIVVSANRFPPNITTLMFSIAEEEPVGAIAGIIQATDIDANPSESISFSIVGSGRASGFFAVNSTSGVLSTMQILDRENLVLAGLFLPENNSTEVITVKATDEGTPRLSSSAQITITLIDINDNAPTFVISNSTIGEVVESDTGNPIVLNAPASDADLGSNGVVSYVLETLDFPANLTPPFIIDDNGVVTATMPLDREERESYTVLIRAMDGGTPSLATVLVIQISVIDVNDNTPIFSQDVYSVNVLETTVPPEVLLQVTAFDPDFGPNGQLDFSISMVNPPSTELFVINGAGEIILNGSLDFETTSLHTLTVRASDRGQPPRFGVATVNINVQNVDEIPPEFPLPCMRSIFEDFSVDTLVTNCIAVDRDDTMVGQLLPVMLYELLDGNVGGAFMINNVGTVAVAANLDREIIDFYSIIVRATDQAGLSTNTTINITILDVNDNLPIILNLPESRLIPVSQLQEQIREVFDVAASDADTGVNAELVFSLGSIVQLPGDSSTNVTVIVSDQGDPMNTATSTLTVFFEEPCPLQQYTINDTTGILTGDFLCSVEATPTDAPVTIGMDITLLCPIIRNIPVMYTWFHNETAILGPLSLNGTAGELTISQVTFEDAGEYECRAHSVIGNLLSPPATVRIQVPPVITVPPADVVVEEERIVSFQCIASGVPTPVITWSRRNENGGLTQLIATDRIVPTNNFLVISSVQISDTGDYVCTGSNPAGAAMASFTVTVFSPFNVIMMPLMAFDMPDRMHTCHEFNTTQFQSTVESITGTRTAVTDQNGENLCNQTACSPSPCVNGGLCDLVTDDSSGRGYTCTCPIGYTGVNCDTDIDECSEEPCLSGGNCTNTIGSFLCDCTAGTTGHRCQYTTICDTEPCAADQLCVATRVNTQGYVCQSRISDGVRVSLSGADNAGSLDDEVNSLREVQQENGNNRGKRQADDTTIDLNDFVTTCEARFTPAGSGQYLLRWACPEGVEPPTGSDEEEICNTLFNTGLVTSCETPSGLTLATSAIDDLPPTDDGSPLSGRDAIELLVRTNALEQLRANGYQAVNFTTAVPFEEPVLSVSDQIIAGAVVAIIVGLFTATLIFCIVFCVVRQRRARKRAVVLNDSHSLHTVYSLNHNPNEDDNHISSAYLNIDHTSPIEHTFTFTNGSSDPPPKSQEPIFDDEIYGRGYIPPQTVPTSSNRERETASTKNGGNKRRGSSLKRSSVILRGRVPSLKQRTHSRDNLLSDDDSLDYDRLEVVSKAQSSSESASPAITRAELKPARADKDEVIYGNLHHTQLGAHGNTGQRWESYWQTHTLLRLTKPSHPEE